MLINTSKDPFLSIIIPVFNIETYLPRCIESILKQSFADYEVIIVDDGSTDSSALICREYEKIDQRVKVFQKENGGVSTARNLGLDNCKGGYVWFVDGDDYINEGALEILKQWTVLNSDVEMFIFSALISHSFTKELFPGPIDWQKVRIFNCESENEFRLLYSQYVVSACYACYRSDLIKQFKFKELRLGEDIFLSMEVLYKAQKIALSPVPLYTYYQRENSAVHQVSKQYYIDSLEYCCMVVSLMSHRRIWIYDQLFRRYRNKIFGEAMVFASRLPHADKKWAKELWYIKARYFMLYFETYKRLWLVFNFIEKTKSYWLGRCLFELPFRLKAILIRWSLVDNIWSKFRSRFIFCN